MTPLAAALTYGARGLRVHPLRPGSKLPMLDQWPDRATADAATIRAWWNHHPAAGVGIVTGRGSGIFVVDIDACHGGPESLAELEGRHGILPDTWRAVTANRGTHVYFRHSGTTIGNRVAIWPGVDIRGERGYVVGPPTVIDGGRGYVWELGYAPEDIALATAPAWLLAAVAVHGAAPRVDPDEPLVLHAGERNDRLVRIAAALRHHGVAEPGILASLTAINSVHAVPPLDMAEIATIARSACRYDRTVHVGRAFPRVPKP